MSIETSSRGFSMDEIFICLMLGLAALGPAGLSYAWGRRTAARFPKEQFASLTQKVGITWFTVFSVPGFLVLLSSLGGSGGMLLSRSSMGIFLFMVMEAVALVLAGSIAWGCWAGLNSGPNALQTDYLEIPSGSGKPEPDQD